MAEYLRNLLKTVTMATICSQIAVVCTSAPAADLVDPTQPPAALESRSGQPPDQPDSAHVLQSVLISPTRRIAVINGQTVALGDRYGEARVVRISEGEVVLRNGQDVQVLKLFPGVEKRGKSERASSGAKEAVVKVR